MILSECWNLWELHDLLHFCITRIRHASQPHELLMRYLNSLQKLLVVRHLSVCHQGKCTALSMNWICGIDISAARFALWYLVTLLLSRDTNLLVWRVAVFMQERGLGGEER